MFLINRLGFYASHPAAFCNLAGPICLFPVGCFCIHSPSPPSGPASPGCCGDTRKKEITARRGDDTSAEKSVQSDKDYGRGMCKNRGGANHAAVNQEDFTGELAWHLEEGAKQMEGWLFCRECNAMETAQCPQRKKRITKTLYLWHE